MANKNMEPIQYAEDLIIKYTQYVKTWDCYHDEPLPIDDVVGDAKQCALIDVRNTIKALEEYGRSTDELQNMEREFAWWDKVEQILLSK